MRIPRIQQRPATAHALVTMTSGSSSGDPPHAIRDPTHIRCSLRATTVSPALRARHVPGEYVRVLRQCLYGKQIEPWLASRVRSECPTPHLGTPGRLLGSRRAVRAQPRVTRVIAERWLSRKGGWMGGPLAAFGAAASAYLLLRTFALFAPGAHASPDLCSTLFASSCDGALTDEHSWVLGIPLAG